MRSATKKRTGKDREYLAFIAAQPCCVPGCTSKNLHKWPAAETRTEVAHVGTRGLSQKCPDRETIPLCAWHHRLGPESHHRLGTKFWTHWGITAAELIQRYQKAFRGTRMKRASIADLGRVLKEVDIQRTCTDYLVTVEGWRCVRTDPPWLRGLGVIEKYIPDSLFL